MKNNLTAIIVTFLRDEYLEVCLVSLRKTYPDIEILVGDNGYPSEEKREFCEKHGAEYYELPFDCGICVGRNELVKKVKTKYVMVGDDDFQYGPHAGVDEMVDFLECHEEFDLIGGRIVEGGKVRNYQGFIHQEKNHFVYERLNLENLDFCAKCGMDFKKCDITFNYFVARTEAVKKVPWDEEIKVAYEHSTFFIDFGRAGFNVAFTPEALVVHKPPVDIKNKNKYKDYQLYRNRKTDKKRFFSKYGINYAIDMAGKKDFYDGTGTGSVDFLIKTLKRPEALRKLLFSIAKYYPHAKIFIGDDDEKFLAEDYKKLWKELADEGMMTKPAAFNLPYDSGLSYARNFLINRTSSPYVLILEDDFVFNDKTKIEDMIVVLETDPTIGVVGGLVRENGEEVHFEHRWEKKGDTLEHVSDLDEYKEMAVKYKITESVLNFALFRREVFNDLKWDESIKIQGEHTDFFLRFKDTNWKVAYCPDIEIEHNKGNQNTDYKALRKRKEFLILAMRKYNLRKIKYLDGFCYEIKDGEIVEYREPLWSK